MARRKSTGPSNGSTLSQRTPSKAGELRIGVLTDIKEPSAENLDNLVKFKEGFYTIRPYVFTIGVTVPEIKLPETEVGK